MDISTYLATRLQAMLVLVLLLLVLAGCAAPGGKLKSIGAEDGTSQAYAMSSEALFALSAEADSAYRAQRWEEAALYYQRLTDSVPNDAWSWFRLGNIRTQQGQFGEAIQAYSVSLVRDGKSAKPWFNLSTVYLLNARKALAQAAQLLSLDDPAQGSIRARMDAIDAVMSDAVRAVPPVATPEPSDAGGSSSDTRGSISKPVTGWSSVDSTLPER